MDLITVDFETYYAREYSLSKLTTEEYVRDDRFEVIGVAVKVNDGETEWGSGTHAQIKKWLSYFDWENSRMLAQNTIFDGFIMSEIFDIHAKCYADTMCMARAIHGPHRKASLAELAKRYKVGEKGDEVINALGKRRGDFTESELACYGDYCVNDVDLTYNIFNKMVRHGFPVGEVRLIDLTLKMFIRPRIELDIIQLEAHLANVQRKKEKVLRESGVTKEDLASSVKFAELLRQYGVEPPMKTSKVTGKPTYAFAKNDEEFKALVEHPMIEIQALCAGRLSEKSTLEEKRTERFLGIAKRGLMPVPLKYYAAHTGRWGGSDKVNLQNLPSRGADAGKLKDALQAPEGYQIIDSDSSQIEARVLAWLAGQDDLVTAFAEGKDVYKIMASAIYNKSESEVTSGERFVGKTTILGCFGPDTEVLTDHGWKRIVEVQGTDMLWDGEEWVTHQGVIPQGEKEVITAWGLSATPDHEILTGHGWQGWNEVVTNLSLFQSAISKASLPLRDGCDITGVITLRCDAPVDGKDVSIDTTLRQKRLPDVIHALKSLVTEPVKSIGGTKIFSLIGTTVNDYLTAYRVAYHDAIQKLVRLILNMGVGVSPYMNRGVQIEGVSYDTLLPSKDGMNQNETLIASTTIGGTNPVTYVLQQDPRTLETNDVFQICNGRSMTYDIAYAGPRNRYTVATDAGAIIVHNCGYGMGSVRFREQLKSFGVDVTAEEAQDIIRVYRETYPQIVELWAEAQVMLKNMLQGDMSTLGKHGALRIIPNRKGIKLPNGLLLRYEQLKLEEEDGKKRYKYKTRGWNDIYGGKVIENVCQAIARCIIGEQMIKISKRYDVVLTVHDAIACVVPEHEVEEAQMFVEECMKWTPDWAKGLPVNCESGYGRSYGDC